MCGLADANSGEFDENNKSKNRVIDFMPDQSDTIAKGGTMRLGAYPCKIRAGSMMALSYKQELIHERHRHRYEFINDYIELFGKNGLVVSGTSPDDKIVETIEIPSNDFFVGVQFHPEFKSRPNKAHPLFSKFIEKSLERARKNETE
jgi:CTP synthase